MYNYQVHLFFFLFLFLFFTSWSFLLIKLSQPAVAVQPRLAVKPSEGPAPTLTAPPEGSVSQHGSFFFNFFYCQSFVFACFSQSILCEKWMLALPVLVIHELLCCLLCLFRGDTGSPNRHVSSHFLTGGVHLSGTLGLPVGRPCLSAVGRLWPWLYYSFHGIGSWLTLLTIFASVI